MIYWIGFGLIALVSVGIMLFGWQDQDEDMVVNGIATFITGVFIWGALGALVLAMFTDIGNENKAHEIAHPAAIRALKDGSYVKQTPRGYSFYVKDGPGYSLTTVWTNDVKVIESDSVSPRFVIYDEKHGNTFWWPWMFGEKDYREEIIVPPDSVTLLN